MFVEITTKKNEKVLINTNLILFCTPKKNTDHTILFDINGNEYEILLDYTSILFLLGCEN